MNGPTQDITTHAYDAGDESTLSLNRDGTARTARELMRQFYSGIQLPESQPGEDSPGEPELSDIGRELKRNGPKASAKLRELAENKPSAHPYALGRMSSSTYDESGNLVSCEGPDAEAAQ